MLPSAIWKHINILSLASTQANISLSNNDCNCMFLIELDFKINEFTVVKPDLMIVCAELKTDFLEFPPTLIIEILSSSTMAKDRTIKFEIYLHQSVKFYIILDYVKKNREVFELFDNDYKQVNKSIFELDKNCEIVFDFDKLLK
ncbi:MAG: Uma2 family endonuclease [Flavobacterium sp.]|nr:Uma2 family endonuclease [Flavobacterium sp.]